VTGTPPIRIRSVVVQTMEPDMANKEHNTSKDGRGKGSGRDDDIKSPSKERQQERENQTGRGSGEGKSGFQRGDGHPTGR
jgi:hypothetical protein